MSKKVLITGGAGFIAHHVIDKMLRETDWKITCLDRLDISGNLNRLHDMLQDHDSKMVSSRLRVVFHDLKAELNEMIVKDIGEIDIILHLAAGSHVDRSIEYPMEFVMDNVIGTTNLLQYARTIKNLKKFVYFSTDEVFGQVLDGSFTEHSPLQPRNPYSASKAGGEELAVAFENTYKLPVFISHTMNVFGPRQHPEKYIPMCIRKVRDNDTVYIHSDNTMTIPGSRFYIHGSDVADAIYFLLNLNEEQLKLVYKPDFGGAKCPKFNVVGKEEINNLQLAKYIAECQNKDLKYEMIDFHSSRPGHDLRYALSGEFMKSLGWQPKYTLRERIKEVVDWSLKNPDWINV